MSPSNQTKKIVINRCHGGFELSPAAIWRLVALGSRVVKNRSIASYPEHIRRTWKSVPTMSTRYLSTYNTLVDTRNGVAWEYEDSHALRSHPDLVAVVEELGEGADGECALLSIETVDADDDYEIVNYYDGLERVEVTTPDDGGNEGEDQ